MILIANPQFPKDKSKAVKLTKEQFAVIHDKLVESMNSGKRFKDAEAIEMLEKAGLPVKFQS